MNQSTTGSLAVRSSNDSRFVPNLHSVRQVQSRAVLALVWHILFVHWHELSTSFHIHLGQSPICLRCRCFLLCTARVCLVQLQAYESKPGAWSRAVATSPRMVCVATRCFPGPWSDELLPRLDVEMAKFSENENWIREAIFKRCDMIWLIWLLTSWHSNHLADAQDVNKAMRSMTPWPQNGWGKRPPGWVYFIDLGKPRGALERVFANFFAQTGKMMNSSPPKKTYNHTRWPKRSCLSSIWPKSPQ